MPTYAVIPLLIFLNWMLRGVLALTSDPSCALVLAMRVSSARDIFPVPSHPSHLSAECAKDRGSARGRVCVEEHRVNYPFPRVHPLHGT